MSDYGSRTKMSFSERRGSHLAEDLALFTSDMQYNNSKQLDKAPQRLSHIRGPPTPSMTTPAADYEQGITGSPPPPPTPAASPGPSHRMADWRDADDVEDITSAKIRTFFNRISPGEKQRLLADILTLCASQQLSFVHQFVSPLLKKDPFTSLPDELCLRILSFIDDPKVLARSSQVSKRWKNLLSDDITWKNLCVKHDYNRTASEPVQAISAPEAPTTVTEVGGDEGNNVAAPATVDASQVVGPASFEGALTVAQVAPVAERPQIKTYKSHFKQRYLVEAAWRNGGTSVTKNITQEGGVVTSLHLTPKYIIVALDNAKIHVFDAQGNSLRTLQGHVMGVWAMVPWEDILVSGGCDRDVRVWDLTTGACIHTLRGHTSTVRCLKMSDENTAISGSRDTTLRVWDIRNGVCRHVLVGHGASVRCLEIKGDIVVSGSYDTTAKVWNINTGRCIQTLQGHFSQIYAIAFDGNRVVTGSLDTNVRIWDPRTAECLAILQGHTSLVGQLQMRGDTLVTGGSDGSVRVWSLEKMCPIHRLAAHDNSVTSLQFDDTRVVSGGSDGRVKIWDLKTGHLVRELIAQSEAVWRVAFEDEKCVALALRHGRTVMEVYSFSPPAEELTYERPLSLQQRALEDAPHRPMSAMQLDYRHPQPAVAGPSMEASGSQDVDMRDAVAFNNQLPSQRRPPATFSELEAKTSDNNLVDLIQVLPSRPSSSPINLHTFLRQHRPGGLAISHTTMFSRAARITRAVPLRARPTLVAGSRAVTTNAASATLEKGVPQAEDETFTITLSDESFETYELDPPPYTLETTKKELKNMYRDMVVTRQMEMAADRLYKEKKIRGFCHLSTGQEAVATGIEYALTKEDDIITAYRCHGYAYMRGASVRSIIGELLGRREGIAYGKGGSMHMFTKGFYGGNGIVGAQVPVGAGLAFAHKYQDTKKATVILYGDGASNQGQVFEAFNMAKLWNLPALFGCENNKYGMGTAANRSSALTDYYKRGQYIPGLKVNGMDVLAVKAAVKYGKEYTAAGHGPLVLEYVTYRYGGHSMSDPGTTYRTREEIQRMRSTNDPIAGLKQKILDWSVVSEEELKAIDKDARAHVNEEVAAAEAMAVPEATPKILFEDIYVRGTEPQFIRGRTPDEAFYFN
ncbi:dehydrogenase E1 component-domain-containing protein [Plectosphaerella cucumerina]|uniref:Pyruvate dehydrogenase E1 component subunit alpha n=1 Tax=Plectosphaerella cucumerina TaxID=40658 RepID=A0A8K0T5L1_9PEZI|nr:dehydrogenase E1 component-domain-containing protein [Plectosphaerella cucumerina]